MIKVRNEGNKIFLQDGRWLGKGEEVVLPKAEARLLLMINEKIVLVEEIKRKRK